MDDYLSSRIRDIIRFYGITVRETVLASDTCAVDGPYAHRLYKADGSEQWMAYNVATATVVVEKGRALWGLNPPPWTYGDTVDAARVFCSVIADILSISIPNKDRAQEVLYGALCRFIGVPAVWHGLEHEWRKGLITQGVAFGADGRDLPRVPADPLQRMRGIQERNAAMAQRLIHDLDFHWAVNRVDRKKGELDDF